MKKLICVALVGCIAAFAYADKPDIQSNDNAIRVSPTKMAALTEDLKLASPWYDQGGIAQDCWDALVFDNFEPVHVLTPLSGTIGYPTDGAGWGGWDPICFSGGATSRWYFGPQYHNPNVVNDMEYVPVTNNLFGMCEVAWYWYVTGTGSAENCYIVLYLYDDFNDCTTGPPPAANVVSGTIWYFGSLGSGGYYFSLMNVCNLGGQPIPADGNGAYNIILANHRDANYIYLATCAQTMVWGWKEGLDYNGLPNTSFQHDLQWDDDAPTDGTFTANECYSYHYAGNCPQDGMWGAAMSLWNYTTGCDVDCGDANCDGAVNGFDIDGFVIAVGSQAAWEALFSCDYFCANDTNGDGAVNGFDIDGFVTVVGGGVCPRDE